MRLIQRLVAFVFTLAAVPTLTFAAGERLRLVDLTPAFAASWEKTKDLPDAERAAAFEADFAPSLPGFYDIGRAGSGGPEKFQARVLRGLRQFPEQRAGIEDVSRRFGAMFAPALTSFEARFGPMTGYPPVYLVDSLGEFDGGTRKLSDGVRLMFGADVIARIHTDHDIRPFFHHELFHIYHHRYFADCEAIWCSLWEEGLAVYVAETLNPGATDPELLLTLPEPIRPAVDAHLAAATCAVRARLDSQDDGDQSALFSSKRLNPELPPRFGYYVGYRVAQRLGQHRSLDELAHLPPEKVRPLIDRALSEMASCAAG